MKKRTIKIMQNHAITLTIAVMVFMMASLTGCSSASEISLEGKEQSSTEGTAESKADKTEQSTENAEVSSEAEPEPTVEATVDATPEPTQEPVVYEGIDMESDLPGEEWIKTFIGVVDEPVAIIYNDNTGKKEIVQENATVNPVNVNPDEDMIAVVYHQEGMIVTKIRGFSDKDEKSTMNYWLSGFDDAETLRQYSEIPVQIILGKH